MSEALWGQLDDYISGGLLEADPILEAVLAESDAAGLPRVRTRQP